MKPIPIEIDVDAAHAALGDAIGWCELHGPKATPRDGSVEALLRSASLEALARTALHGVYGEHPRLEPANAPTWRENFERRRRADEILLIETFPRLVALRREHALRRRRLGRQPRISRRAKRSAVGLVVGARRRAALGRRPVSSELGARVGARPRRPWNRRQPRAMHRVGRGERSGRVRRRRVRMSATL
jgi:hypothetical protein